MGQQLPPEAVCVCGQMGDDSVCQLMEELSGWVDRVGKGV